MRRIGAWVLAISGAAAGLVGAAGVEGRDEAPSLDGHWVMSSFVLNGEVMPRALIAPARLHIADGEFRPIGLDAKPCRATFDPSKTPAEVTFKELGTGRESKGIYAADGDELTVCRGLDPDAPRPKAFSAHPGSGLTLVVWRRNVGEDDKAALVREEMKKFQGVWQLVSAEKEGVKTPEEQTKQVRVTIKGNTHTVTFGDQVVAHDVTFEVDPSATPKQTTDTLTDAENRGKQIKGIYKLEGDELTSCVAPLGKPRPTEFASPAGSGHTLRVFRRVKSS